MNIIRNQHLVFINKVFYWHTACPFTCLLSTPAFVKQQQQSCPVVTQTLDSEAKNSHSLVLS